MTYKKLKTLDPKLHPTLHNKVLSHTKSIFLLAPSIALLLKLAYLSTNPTQTENSAETSLVSDLLQTGSKQILY